MKYLVLAILLSSCSASFYCRKCKEKGIIKQDTVFAEKTIIKPGDTTTVYVPQWSKVRDTTIFQDRIKIHYTVIHDTLRTQVECPGDTIRVKVPVTIHESIICPPKSNFWKYLALALGVVTMLVLLVKR